MRSFAKILLLLAIGAVAGFGGAQLFLKTRILPLLSAERPLSFAPILEKVIPAVVTLRVVGEAYAPVELLPRGDNSPQRGVAAAKRAFRTGGSGVILDASKGLIVTNNHVVENATTISVGLHDGRRMVAKLIGRDPGTDLAILQIEPKSLPTIAIGVSDETRVGDPVIAIGNPFGLEGTATIGIVGAVMRTEIGFEAFEDFLQIDAHIDPGNSGGALINLHGELIGINTLVGGRKGGTAGIGFAIPIDIVRTLQSEIILHGRVRRGSLGIVVDDLQLDWSTRTEVVTRGAVVTQIMPGSSAADAGIVPGDIIVRVANKPARNAAEFMTRTAMVPLGKSIPVTVHANGAERTVTLRVSNISLQPVMETVPPTAGRLAGAKLADILPGHARYGEIRGTEIVALPEGTAAAMAGLEIGDIIVAVDKEKIGSAEDLFERIEAAGSKFRVEINRGGIPAWLQIER